MIVRERLMRFDSSTDDKTDLRGGPWRRSRSARVPVVDGGRPAIIAAAVGPKPSSRVLGVQMMLANGPVVLHLQQLGVVPVEHVPPARPRSRERDTFYPRHLAPVEQLIERLEDAIRRSSQERSRRSGRGGVERSLWNRRQSAGRGREVRLRLMKRDRKLRMRRGSREGWVRLDLMIAGERVGLRKRIAG